MEKKAGIVICSEWAFNKRICWEGKWMQHGVAYIYEMMKKEIGTDNVGLIDMRRLTDWNHFYEVLQDYDILFFSVMSTDYLFATNCIHEVRTRFPYMKIIAGGLDPTYSTYRWDSNKEIDHVLLGEGELSVPKMIKDIKAGTVMTKTVRGESMENLEIIPYINREEWDVEFPYYMRYWSGQHRFYTMLTSRACVYKCTFCAPASDLMFGRSKEKRRSVENVMGELRNLINHPVASKRMKSWMIHDDNFAQNKEWVNRFMDAFEKEFKPMPLIIQARVNIMQDEALVKRMRDVLGLEWAIIGFESGSDNVLRALNKNANRAMNIKAAQNCHKYGIRIFANIMFGTPTETREDAMQTVDMVRIIKPSHVSPTTFMPYPGSYLYDECKRKGLILAEHGNRYAGQAKIKGIDYEFLNGCIAKCFEYQSLPSEEQEFFSNRRRKLSQEGEVVYAENKVL